MNLHLYLAIIIIILSVFSAAMLIVATRLTKEVTTKLKKPPVIEVITKEEFLKTLNENRDSDDEFTI